MRRLLVPILILSAACTPAAPGADEGGEAGSEAGSATGEPCEPTLDSIAVTVFADNCVSDSCHGGADPAASMDLSADAGLADRLVGVPAASCDGWVRVSPMQPDASFIFHKLTTEAPDCGGDRMPPLGTTLSDDDVACITGWINTVQGPTCETCGGEVCIDLQADALNCGSCAMVCPPGVACNSGECACPNGTALCNGACVDTQSDPANCGACDMQCDAAQVCLTGDCADGCGALTQCGQACIDTTSDAANCGGCGTTCSAGQECVDSSCSCGPATIFFSSQIGPLLNDTCTAKGCHGFPMPREGLDLRTGNAYGSLVNTASEQCADGTRVTPGSVADSYLINKLLGVDMCTGTRMPKADESLPPAQIQLIETWICQGALDN